MSQIPHPLISIILPAYNAEKYIGEAINSILNQTYRNFELIIVNDGSTDNTESEILKIKDDRIQYLFQKNQGMALALNKGISIAKGDFIARQDADDISIKERLEKQINFLIQNKDYALIGTCAKIINENGHFTGRYHNHPYENEVLKFYLLFDNPFVHSSIMFRKEIIRDCGIYNEKLHPLIQDFEYWFRISGKFKIANISEHLQLYRELNSGISSGTKNFYEIVAKQCAIHLASVWNAPKEQIKDFAYTYHNCIGEVNSKLSTERIITQLADKCLSQGLKEKQKIINHHVFKVKRSIYNNKINNSGNASPENILYRIKRRLLFFKYKT